MFKTGAGRVHNGHVPAPFFLCLVSTVAKVAQIAETGRLSTATPVIKHRN